MNVLVMLAAVFSGIGVIPAYLPYPTREKLTAVIFSQFAISLLLGYFVPNEPTLNIWVSLALAVTHGGWATALVIARFVERQQTKREAQKYLLEW